MFKVGDKVRTTFTLNGKLYETKVVYVDRDIYTIERSDGWSNAFMGPNKYWNVTASNLTLIEPSLSKQYKRKVA